ncbi:MAG: EAL domain-containing protein, partial [Cyanobacteria bacterium P01_F01_bin.86]
MSAWFVPMYAIANVMATSVCIALMLLFPHNQAKRNLRLHFVLSLLAFWTFVYACGSFSQQAPVDSVFWLRLQVIPIALIAPAWLLFVCDRIGHPWHWFQCLFFVLPVATIGIVWHVPFQAWMWRLQTVNQVGKTSMPQYATGHWFQFVHLPYSYLLILVCSALLIRAVVEATPTQRWEFQFLIVAEILVGVVNIVVLSPLLQTLRFFDLTPIAFTLVCLFYYVSVSRRVLLPASPLAYRQIFEGLETAILVINHERQLLEFNSQAEKWLGLTSQNLMSKVESLLPFLTEASWAHLQQQGTVECTDVHTHWLLRETPIYKTRPFQEKLTLGHVLCLDNISEERKLQAQLLEGALLYDPLTQLPNRTLFMKRLEAALEQKRAIAVVFLDLDRFKSINDSLGHRVGDYLLKRVAQQVQTCLKPQDTMARFGGDEFAILMEEAVKTVVLEQCDRLQTAIQTPILFEGYQLLVSASIGVAFADHLNNRKGSFHLSGELFSEADQLLRDADLAMYESKASGKACYRVYNDELHQQAMATIEMETALHQALEQYQFKLYYQPIVELRTGRILGVEALLRWHHPNQGLLLPAAFMSIATNLKLIEKIDTWVIATACQQYQQWRRRYPHRDLMMAVNVSANNWGTQQLMDAVTQGLAGQRGHWLKLEISEDTLLDSPVNSDRVINQLSQLGVEVQLDDFGTGYSSLSYLCKIYCNGLKVDQSFIHNLGRLPQADILVKTIIDLAHSLNLTVVAEGIETDEQREVLTRLG